MGVAQFGSALEWGSRGRGFKSLHPYQKKILHNSVGFFLLKKHFIEVPFMYQIVLLIIFFFLCYVCHHKHKAAGEHNHD